MKVYQDGNETVIDGEGLTIVAPSTEDAIVVTAPNIRVTGFRVVFQDKQDDSNDIYIPLADRIGNFIRGNISTNTKRT